MEYLTERVIEYEMSMIIGLEVVVITSNSWVVFLQAVTLYTLMYTWPLVSSTGVTLAALWQYRTESGELNQTAQDYIV